MVSAALDLPTEILYAVFELCILLPSNAALVDDTRALTVQNNPQDVSSNLASLSSNMNQLLQCILLSQVCSRWRDVAIGFHALWTRMHLSGRSFVREDFDDVKATEMSSHFLSRSAHLPIHLEISISSNGSLTRWEENISGVLKPHIERFRALSVASSETIINTVLDVFIDHHLSRSLNAAQGRVSLDSLHLQRIPSGVNRVCDNPRPTFPSDLSAVAPHLAHLRVEGVQIADYPRWNLQEAYLSDIFLSYKHHFHLFSKARVATLILHRIFIPGGIPYVRSLSHQQPSTVTYLHLSELRCNGPKNEHRDIYALFFRMSLFPALKKLDLVGLTQDALDGLIAMLKANPSILYDSMQSLTLRKVNVTSMDTVILLASSFPAVDVLVLERMRGVWLFRELWCSNSSVWPMLQEIKIDGEIVTRDNTLDILSSENVQVALFLPVTTIRPFMFSTELPAEIIILILSYLPLSSISSLLRLNKEWFTFVNGNLQNENTIYRNAAFLEGFVSSPTVMLEELQGIYSPRVMQGVNDWRDLCRKRRTISKAWAGRAPSTISPSLRIGELSDNSPRFAHYRRVHRIKVDEKVGITMTTTQTGGLVVRDLDSNEVLWELPAWYVRAYAHLEYDEGYMVFDRDDGNKEVWRRVAIVDEGANLDPMSLPDERQNNVINYLAHLTANSSSERARFKPYAVLHMPEPTRAYRFVYPTLLVASLERAYLWDIKSGRTLQIIENIQIIHGPGVNEEEEEYEEQASEEYTSPELFEATDTLLGVSYSPDKEREHEHDRDEDDDEEEDEEDEEEEEEDEEDTNLPQFLGLVRYVDISERHVFFAGRYLLRIFSRETGKCVVDIPSTRWRYGRCRWEVSSKASVGDVGRCDTYEKAREEGREGIRVPLRFNHEEHSRASRVIVDQFVAAHISNDGKHLVALLSGSRIIIIHHFEQLLKTRLPAFPSSHQGEWTRAERRSKGRGIRAARKRIREEKDKEIFQNTLDIQLGPPSASSSVYLAYENGRIGVVTTNALYVIFPSIPSLPTDAILPPTIDAPYLQVTRFPFFSNPSWLTEVSCLMISDTALFLNWNPGWPVRARPGRSTDEDASWYESFGAGGNNGWNMSRSSLNTTRSVNDEEKLMRLVNGWETEYENALVDYEMHEDRRYMLFPNGDMYVAPEARDIEDSQVSMVYSINFAPLFAVSPATSAQSSSEIPRGIDGMELEEV